MRPAMRPAMPPGSSWGGLSPIRSLALYARRVALGGRAAGAALAVLGMLCAGTSERKAGAGPEVGGVPQTGKNTSAGTLSSPDGGAISAFAAQARQGYVVPPALGDIEHMCALLTTCDKLPIPPSLVPADFKSCVTQMASELTSASAVNFSLTMRECGLASNSCASLRACALRGASPEACTGRGKQNVVGFCDVEGRALTCWHDQVLAVRDCPRGGEQCVVVDGQPSCTLGPCPSGMKDGDAPRCSASRTHTLRCEKGRIASLDCDTFGLSCVTAADGSSACATTGAACSGKGIRCDGTVAIGCVNGHEVRVNCGSAGLACSPTDDSMRVGACVEPDGATPRCDPSAAAKCSGPNIEYCFAGKSRAYYCKALGFSTCEMAPAGARCAP
jgi:hypothetical protein